MSTSEGSLYEEPSDEGSDDLNDGEVSDSEATRILSELNCLENEYLVEASKQCKNRSNYPILSCIEYNVYDDKCNLCDENHYLNELSNLCLESTLIIKNCVRYNRDAQCILCSPGFYMGNGKCNKTPVSHLPYSNH